MKAKKSYREEGEQLGAASRQREAAERSRLRRAALSGVTSTDGGRGHIHKGKQKNSYRDEGEQLGAACRQRKAAERSRLRRAALSGVTSTDGGRGHIHA